MRSSISLLIWGLASPPIALLLGGAGTEGTGGTGLGRRSELILLGKGFGGLSGASTASVNEAPASESRERRPKAATDEEQEEDDDDDEEPPISDRVRRVGGRGTRGLG